MLFGYRAIIVILSFVILVLLYILFFPQNTYTIKDAERDRAFDNLVSRTEILEKDSEHYDSMVITNDLEINRLQNEMRLLLRYLCSDSQNRELCGQLES